MSKEPQSTLERKSSDELRDLAVRIVRNEVFTDKHIAPSDVNLLPIIFAPLGFLGRDQLLKLQRKERPGMFYAFMENAGPRAINGYPIFFELHMLHPNDATIVWEKFEEISTAMK